MVFFFTPLSHLLYFFFCKDILLYSPFDRTFFVYSYSLNNFLNHSKNTLFSTSTLPICRLFIKSGKFWHLSNIILLYNKKSILVLEKSCGLCFCTDLYMYMYLHTCSRVAWEKPMLRITSKYRWFSLNWIMLRI